AEDESAGTRGLATRADLVGKVKKLEGQMVASMNYGWQNAMDQLKIANAETGLNTKGFSMLKK
ncbi:hypothetical protein A2U01_0109579, partial [Trifolium medium]|nr:hypothetical protein [Trifolium medium]